MTTYTPFTWIDAVTPLNASDFDHADTGIKNATDEIIAQGYTGLVGAFAGTSYTQYSGPNYTGRWAVCNGAAISRTTYAELYNIIGTTYGSGDGSTTFNVPDLRGIFIRGLDEGRGVDTGRTLGTEQNQAVKTHSHTYNYHSCDSGGPNVLASGPLSAATTETGLVAAGSIEYGGADQRPKNYAMIYCIKL